MLEQEGEIQKYKAMLELVPYGVDLADAVTLAESASAFTLYKTMPPPGKYAMDWLKGNPDPVIEKLSSVINYNKYGALLLDQHNAAKTSYGTLLSTSGFCVEMVLGLDELQGAGQSWKSEPGMEMR